MADSEVYDLMIIGAGPGGYIAAERAGALGKKTLLVEQANLGGVCLNEGCIPSKTLLFSAKLFAHIQEAKRFGVITDAPRFELATVMQRKTKIIETLRKGVAYQMNRHHVTVVAGTGALVDRQQVRVGDQTYQGRDIMIATGSSPIMPPIPGADLPHVLTSTGVLNLQALPKSIVIIGGGVIGMEFASFFRQVGVKVTVVEMLPEILPNFDADVAEMVRKAYRDVDFRLGCKVEKITAQEVFFSKDGQEQSVPAEVVLMSVGRKPNLAGLGLEALGVAVERGGIKVDDQLRTNLPGVYAVGDVNGRSLLAHAASRMGEVAVKTMFGGRDRMRYHAIPWVVYSDPEIAGVGLTEREAAAKGIKVEVGRLQMRANGRFLAEHEGAAPGFCKVIVDAQTKVLRGVYLVGGHCSEIIYGAAAMIEAEFRVSDIREVVFPHPTMGEIWRDAIWELNV